LRTMVTEADVHDVDRACRKLEKQLAQASKLEQQLAQGKTLEANQLAKLQRKVQCFSLQPLITAQPSAGRPEQPDGMSLVCGRSMWD